MHSTDTSREEVIPLSRDPELQRRFAVLKEPIPGNLRFGLLLEVLDRVAAETALDYARTFEPEAYVVTAAVDEIVLRHVAGVTDDIRCLARINRVGSSSMEVGIRVESTRAHLASCYFTMVARAGKGAEAHSVKLPPLSQASDAERTREARAMARRETWRRAGQSAVDLPSREEFVLLRELHDAQDRPGFDGLLAGDLVTETWERTYPEQENNWQVIFGGYIMRRAYELSHICAERVASARPVISAVNRVNFFHPVQIGDKLHMTSRVVYAAGPAVCVETGIERISRDRAARALSNSCLFTFLNVDPDLAPQDVPPLYPSNYAEDARYLEGRRNLASLSSRFGQHWLGADLMARSGGH
ncbi:MAG TPA: hotdog domain-containing protein [Anaeromyxobacteraceae bacterium]|jgi:acyl-CoA hydrolase|nr:hotdog domain-containing protein [Anaeromyxobacteraceae bacterium]